MFIISRRDCFFRYLAAACLVFLLGHIQYRLLYAALSWMAPRAGAAWSGHFILTTLWAHSLHRWFTFRGTPQHSYGRSLMRTFGSRLILMVISTVMMLFFCDWHGYSPYAGWAVTSFTVGVLDFFMMSRFSICAA
jgi:putative flippase GtrA